MIPGIGNRISINESKMTPIYGYFAGGETPSGRVANTDRIVFSSGVTSLNTVSNLSQVKDFMGSVSDGNTYGYFAGGDTGAYIVTTDRIIFSSGATSVNTVSNLSIAKNNMASVSDGNNYGYFAGGRNSAGSNVSTTDKIVFSSGTTSANTVSNLSVAKRGVVGLSDTSNYGYFAGGNTVASYSTVNTVERIVFSTGVTSLNTISNLTQAKFGAGAVSDGSTYGYIAGGNGGGYTTIADRIVFSTGITSSNTVSVLSVGREYLSGISDGVNYGYFVGGYTGSNIATANRISFSSGVITANTASDLSQAKAGFGCVSDYFA